MKSIVSEKNIGKIGLAVKMLLGCLALIIGLGYIIPSSFGFNIAEFASSKIIISVLRMILGITLLGTLGAMFYKLGNHFRQDDESISQGIHNAWIAQIIQQDALTIIVLASGGIALIAWGISTLLLE